MIFIFCSIDRQGQYYLYMMEENSMKNTSLDAVTVLEPGLLSCNDTKITTSAVGADQPVLLPKSHDDDDNIGKNPLLSKRPDFSYLAELYWKYPTVHQEFYVCPLSNKAHQHAFLAKARQKSERMKQALDVEPERNRASGEGLLKPPSRQISGSKKSTSTGPRTSVTPVKRRTVNQSLVNQQNKLNFDRRPTGAMNRRQKSQNSDPSAALAEFRMSKGLRVESSVDMSINRSNISTPVILDAIRIQREDVEQNTNSAKCARCNKKCCNAARIILRSSSFNRIAIFTVVTIVLFLCVVAIVYPIVKALLQD